MLASSADRKIQLYLEVGADDKPKPKKKRIIQHMVGETRVKQQNASSGAILCPVTSVTEIIFSER